MNTLESPVLSHRATRKILNVNVRTNHLGQNYVRVEDFHNTPEVPEMQKRAIEKIDELITVADQFYDHLKEKDCLSAVAIKNLLSYIDPSYK